MVEHTRAHQRLREETPPGRREKLDLGTLFLPRELKVRGGAPILFFFQEHETVPMDAAARADLIDLMARVLAVVIHKEGGRIDDRGPVQFEDQAGAPGSQSDRVPAAVQRETGTAE
jgi:hypothetical protein